MRHGSSVWPTASSRSWPNCWNGGSRTRVSGFITVTDVRLTNDMREATVFYTVLGEDAEREATAAALESAKGHLRTEVGRITGVRFAPSLTFVPDALPTTAAHIEDLLKQAAASDAEVQQRAAAARTPAMRIRTVNDEPDDADRRP